MPGSLPGKAFELLDQISRMNCVNRLQAERTIAICRTPDTDLPERAASAGETSRRTHERGIACFVRLDRERAIWVSDDGRWQWDAKAQRWTGRSSTRRGDPSEPHETPAPDDPPTDEAEPTSDEPVGLDAGLGLGRMWSPPDARSSRRTLRGVWSGAKTSRRTRLVLAGTAAAALTGAALVLLLPGGDTEKVGAPPLAAHAYSTEAQESYLQQCRANPEGSDELCGCSLAKFQERYSQEDFVALQARFAAQDPTAVQQFTAIAAACLPH